MGGLSPDETDALNRALAHGVAYRQRAGARPIPAQVSAAAAMATFHLPLPDHGRPASEVIDSMVRDADPGLLQMVSPRFFGYVIGASDPAGLAADILTSAWSQVTGYSDPTPAAAAIENTVCDWVRELLGLPEGCGAGLVTGATMANTTAIMAARNALLRRANWDVEAQGLFQAPEIHVVIGAEAHSATAAALRYAGLGADRVHRVAADAQGRIDPVAFRQTLASLDGPILVILQAGHVTSGAFDPFAELIPAAREKQAWVHIDGAFGLWVHAVPELAGRLTGVAAADSWAVDLHKWLNAPYDSGIVFTRDRAPLVAAMSAKGNYLPEEGAVPDPNDTVPELSRRARGMPSYAILQTHGRDGIRAMITRHCRFAERAAAAIASISGLTVMNEIACNQVAFRAGEGERGDRLTATLLAAIQARGRAYPSHGHWKGREIIRVSIIGHKTEAVDIDILLDEIRVCWDAVRSNEVEGGV